MTLRTYQQTAVDLTLEELRRNSRAHLVLATGAGKSRVLANVALDVLQNGTGKKGGVLVSVPSTQIRKQMVETFRSVLGDRFVVAELPAHRGPTAHAHVIVGVPQTLVSWSASDSSFEADLIIVDEAHHATTPTHTKLFNLNPHAMRVGATATPYRLDGQRLDPVLGRCVMVRDFDHPELAPYLTPAVWSQIRLNVDLEQVSTSKGDYRTEALGALLSTRTAIANTVSSSVPLIASRRTVVFAANVDHAERLAAEFGQQGLAARTIFGSTKHDDRGRIISELAAGNIDVVVTVAALLEGFDCPEITALVIARPTKSELCYLQMVGRGLRKSRGKTDCLVIDVTGRQLNPAPTGGGQIFLPSLMEPITDDTAEWWSPDRRMGVGQDRPPRQLTGSDRQVATWAWIPGPAGRLLVPLKDGQTGVLDPDLVTGLWTARLISNGHSVDLAEPLPARYAVDRFVPMVDSRLTKSDAAWRRRSASFPAMEFLRRLDRAKAEQASLEGWAGGHVSDVITVLQAERALAAASTRREVAS